MIPSSPEVENPNLEFDQEIAALKAGKEGQKILAPTLMGLIREVRFTSRDRKVPLIIESGAPILKTSHGPVIGEFTIGDRNGVDLKLDQFGVCGKVHSHPSIRPHSEDDIKRFTQNGDLLISVVINPLEAVDILVVTDEHARRLNNGMDVGLLFEKVKLRHPKWRIQRLVQRRLWRHLGRDLMLDGEEGMRFFKEAVHELGLKHYQADLSSNIIDS